LWASQENGAQATASRETGAVPDGTAAARIDVQAISGVDWHIEFAQRDRNLQAGVTYNLAFWARSDVTRTITLSSQKGSPDWDNYGLWRQLQIGPTWQEYAIPFQATATVSDARLQFLLGSRTGTVWLDNVRLTRRPPQVYRRDFTHGSVLLNGERSTQAVTLGPGYRRLSGSQAPRLQLILDDAATGFTTTGSWVTQTLDSGEWQASGPFYHDWGESLHLLNGASGEARWSLPITATDTYTISAWWPAAPGAAGWNPAARFEIIADSRVLASAVFDQHTGGDQWHTVGVVPLVARSSASVRLACTGAPCAADAVYLSSRARYNDSAPATTITLAGLDGIILSREARIFLPLLAK
jgi:hypothetical protein